MRTATVSAVFMAIASAFLLYGLSYNTRLVETRVIAAEQAAEAARSDIAVLKAERAHLARPDRIELLARAQGLRPPSESQFAGSDEADGIVTGSTSR